MATRKSARMRKPNGNMLALLTAITLGVVLALIFFGLRYTRILGSNQEQRTAVEAAALAAANDLSKVIVEDPNFGFISLSDFAPSGANTSAKDNYAMPVQSINTLFATIRNDMIIASEMGDTTMMNFAKLDYNNALKAKDLLITSLKASLVPGGGGATDIDGNSLDPYNDAVKAYEQNIIRMTGGKSNLNKATFKLTLGCVPNIATNAPVPQPALYANVAPNQALNGYYKAYTNIPFNGNDFVFAGVGRSIMLVDHRAFQASSGQPWDIPSVVKAEGDQVFNEVENGSPVTRTVHAAACAAPASVTDPRPAPGALAISFPDGNETVLNKPGDVLTNPDFVKTPISLWTPPGVDAPVPATVLNPIGSLPVIGGSPSIADMWRRILYDWIRRAGPKADVQATLDMLNTPFIGQPAAVSDGFQEAYVWDASGKIVNNVNLIDDTPYPVISSNQAWGYNRGGFKGKSLRYVNTYLYDNSLNVGRINGGIHGGEPYVDPTLKVVTASQNIAALPPGTKYSGDYGAGGMGAGTGSKGSNDGKATALPTDYVLYPVSPGPGTVRPTYLTNGLVGELRIRDWMLATMP